MKGSGQAQLWRSVSIVLREVNKMLTGIRSRRALKAPKIIHEACCVVNTCSAKAGLCLCWSV
eukprot:6467151-Amphidinium_carterae.2